MSFTKLCSKLFTKLTHAAMVGYTGYEIGSHSSDKIVIRESKQVEAEQAHGEYDINSVLNMILIVIAITIALIVLKELHECYNTKRAERRESRRMINPAPRNV